VLYNGYDEIFASGPLAGADGVIGSTLQHHGPGAYQGIVKALKARRYPDRAETANWNAIESLDFTDQNRRVFRGLVRPPLYGCRFRAAAPQTGFGPVDEKTSARTGRRWPSS